jgi:hypothetical protein
MLNKAKEVLIVLKQKLLSLELLGGVTVSTQI